ncbi:MAG: NAD(P)-binding domain-containing protein, partial [Sciscionella sp.]|nr:NAD(P)-binding domain-containing protein [Sciscionella sp.]
MSERVDVAIIGAGPYGLSLAAHLRAAGIRFRQFGLPMDLWRTKMPKGMYLKSQGFASNLSDPAGVHTLGAFCAETGREYADYGLPVSLEIFTAYGAWFAEKHAPDVEPVLISEVHASGGQFELVTEAGERMLARNVVVATGVEHFAHVPPVVACLPTELCTHASAHDDLAGFAGRDVIVLGAGQSALETAALLHEHGAGVRVLVRKEKLVWNGPPLPPTRPLLQRLREPEAGLGSGLGTWFYSTKPWLYRRMTASTR